MVEERTEDAPTNTWAGGRLRRAPSGRHQRVVVRVTDDELGALRHKASLAGVSPPRLLLELGLLGTGVTLAERRRRLLDFSHLQGQLRRLTASTEQLALTLQDGALPLGVTEAITEITRLRVDVAEAMDRLMDGLG